MRTVSFPAGLPERAALCGLVAAILALVVGGSVLAALAFLFASLMGWTRVIEENRAKGKPTYTDGQRLVVAIVCVTIGMVILGRGSKSENAPERPRPISIATLPRADALRAMERKLSALAVRPLERANDAAAYRRLGKATWKRADEYRRWAALAAAQSDECDRVNALAIWETATKADLSWNVTCANGERFKIDEAQARSVKAQFDTETTLKERREYASVLTIAKPLSAAFKDFDALDAEVGCEDVLRRASVDRNSFQPSGKSQVARDEEAGQAVVARDYDSRNAMGGTISGRYECTVDAAAKRVVGLRTQDVFGVHVIVAQ